MTEDTDTDPDTVDIDELEGHLQARADAWRRRGNSAFASGIEQARIHLRLLTGRDPTVPRDMIDRDAQDGDDDA